MILAFEYAFRRGLFSHLLKLPCSLFLESTTGYRMIIGMHQVPNTDQCVLKEWLPSEQAPGQPLPPFRSTQVPMDDVLKGRGIVPHNFSPIRMRFSEMHTLSYQGVREEPPTQHFCDVLYEEHLFPREHKEFREHWLWETFFTNHSQITGEELSKHCKGLLPKDQMIKMMNHKSLWGHWTIWRAHMLDFPITVAPEMFFHYVRKWNQ